MRRQVSKSHQLQFREWLHLFGTRRVPICFVVTLVTQQFPALGAMLTVFAKEHANCLGVKRPQVATTQLLVFGAMLDVFAEQRVIVLLSRSIKEAYLHGAERLHSDLASRPVMVSRPANQRGIMWTLEIQLPSYARMQRCSLQWDLSGLSHSLECLNASRDSVTTRTGRRLQWQEDSIPLAAVPPPTVAKCARLGSHHFQVQLRVGTDVWRFRVCWDRGSQARVRASRVSLRAELSLNP